MNDREESEAVQSARLLVAAAAGNLAEAAVAMSLADKARDEADTAWVITCRAHKSAGDDYRKARDELAALLAKEGA